MVQVPLSVFFSFLKIQIQNEIQNVQGRFTQLREILDSEEAKELRKLQDELGVILKKLAESENDLVQEKLLVNNLISDVERRLQGSTMELLQVRPRKEKQPAHGHTASSLSTSPHTYSVKVPKLGIRVEKHQRWGRGKIKVGD